MNNIFHTVAAGDAAPLTFRLLHVLHWVEARLEGGLATVGLSLAKFRVLEQLAVEGAPLPLGALAERCACVRSNMTQLVDRLQAEGLVSRAGDANDRRMIRAVLTAEGQARFERGFRSLQESERDVLAGLAEADRQALLAQLDRLHIK